MALDLVSDYIAEARRLLQDEATPYRYPDSDFLAALNLGLLEARRLRPDIFIGLLGVVPAYTAVAQTVAFEAQYRPSLVYFIAGHIGARDDEASQEARAVGFMSTFSAHLSGRRPVSDA